MAISPWRLAVSTLRRGLRVPARFWRARSGIAAVEFSLILPIMITLYFGLTEITPGVNVYRKLTLLSRAVADLSSRSEDLTTADLKTIFSASAAIMRPFDEAGTKTQMVVSSIGVNKTTWAGTVEWSCSWNEAAIAAPNGIAARVKNTPYTVPEGFKNDGTDSFILVETRYAYKPVIGQAIKSEIYLKQDIPWPVRDASRVKPPSACPT